MNTKTTDIYEFSIQGMSCTGCAARIERSLTTSPEVARAVVQFSTHTAVVESVLAADVLKKKIESLGFKADLLSAETSLEEKHLLAWRAARRRLVAALVFGLPVIALGMLHHLSNELWVRWISGTLTFALLAGPGFEFFKKAVQLLRQRTAGMDTLVALGAGISFVWSCVQAFRGSGEVYFETAAAIVSFIMIGKYIEHRMTWRATSSMGALLRLQPSTALRLIQEGKPDTETVDLRFIRSGDVLLTRVGERFAADGLIVEGRTEVDESLLTGESRPLVRIEGDPVIAGSLNQVGAVFYKAQAIGPHSRLGEVVQFIERTQLSKPPVQRIADRVSAFFVPVMLALAALTFMAWFFILRSELPAAFNAAVSVLVVACPCALGLATPIAVAVATSRAARAGLLFRDLSALEQLQSVNTIVLDKTGTLTDGRPSVGSELSLTGETTEKISSAVLKQLVCRLEQRSQHPAALAVVNYLSQNKTADSKEFVFSDLQEIAGEGLRCVWSFEGRALSIRIGRPTAEDLQKLSGQAPQTWVVCVVDNELRMAWSLVDSLRKDTPDLIARLKKLNIRAVLASGDQPDAVVKVASSLGLEHYSLQSPQMKAELIQRLRAEGSYVAMLGDGINDAPALAAAHVGIAMGSGTDAAQQTASLTLRDSGLAGVLSAIRLSKITFNNIRQNLVWAFGYNILLIPLAMSGRLTPVWAAAAMATSSLFVVLNSLRLLRSDIPNQSSPS
jgi:Cu+-exporting ATPase